MKLKILGRDVEILPPVEDSCLGYVVDIPSLGVSGLPTWEEDLLLALRVVKEYIKEVKE